ncbi:chemotaxis protein CheX [Roseateles oligotrophus]|uniref:Chemotaxis phosphatase CheX-like domain-containing protein n=1 Tax=Roseateles oligotrophus TaxID=1769250 RepID=A0ABT2YAP7_9BURK|nr:chemotaxis protein CheX [Roseateles oligotrophus]MCV2367353.1 hypothetical protein [Roseateles oligotrophus]
MQAAVVATKLANVWAGLSGKTCPFVAAPCLPSLRPDDACFSLPIADCITGFSSHPHALVLLMLGAADAQALAAAMFGCPREQLQPADVQDAGMELCNILSACLLQCLEDNSLTSLGLPEMLSQPQWQVSSRTGEPRALFVSADQTQRLAVMLTDIHAQADEAMPGDARHPGGLSSEN